MTQNTRGTSGMCATISAGHVIVLSHSRQTFCFLLIFDLVMALILWAAYILVSELPLALFCCALSLSKICHFYSVSALLAMRPHAECCPS